jgi:hypothetical protein
MEVEMLVPACLNTIPEYYTLGWVIINKRISSIHVCNSFGHA